MFSLKEAAHIPNLDTSPIVRTAWPIALVTNPCSVVPSMPDATGQLCANISENMSYNLMRSVKYPSDQIQITLWVVLSGSRGLTCPLLRSFFLTSAKVGTWWLSCQITAGDGNIFCLDLKHNWLEGVAVISLKTSLWSRICPGGGTEVNPAGRWASDTWRDVWEIEGRGHGRSVSVSYSLRDLCGTQGSDRGNPTQPLHPWWQPYR